MLKKSFIALVLGVAFSPMAHAEGGRIRTITDSLTQTECSACHMAFPSGLLPARSWSAIMNDLGNHFGEDASLDEADRKSIETYLTANAADTGGHQPGIMRSIGSATPLRITETKWWRYVHNGEVPRSAWSRAGSKSNCTACHRGADRGSFGDD